MGVDQRNHLFAPGLSPGAERCPSTHRPLVLLPQDVAGCPWLQDRPTHNVIMPNLLLEKRYHARVLEGVNSFKTGTCACFHF